MVSAGANSTCSLIWLQTARRTPTVVVTATLTSAVWIKLRVVVHGDVHSTSRWAARQPTRRTESPPTVAEAMPSAETGEANSEWQSPRRWIWWGLSAQGQQQRWRVVSYSGSSTGPGATDFPTPGRSCMKRSISAAPKGTCR
jgi:hypothetical protein